MNGGVLRAMHCAAVLLALGWPAAASAQGTPVQLICQAYLAQPDCTEVTGGWPGGAAVTFVATCTEMCGKGADMKDCGTGEQVSPATLAMETALAQPVAGAFTQIGHCIGLPLISFSGALAAGTTYNVVGVFGDPHGRVKLLSFAAAGNVTGSDGGAVPPGSDGGAVPPGSDGGAVPPGSDGGALPPGSDGSTVGRRDGGGTGTGSTPAEGCGCGVATHGVPTGLSLLGLLLLAWRRRRCG